MRDRLLVVAIVTTMSACLFPSVGDLDQPKGDASLPEDANDAALDVAPADVKSVDVAVDVGSSDAPKDAPPDVGPPTPITFEQVNAQEFSGASVALISLASVLPHDSIIVCVGTDGTGNISVTDSVNSTYKQYVAFMSTADGTGKNYVWAAFNTTGGNITLTVDMPSSHTGFEVYMVEYSGLTDFDVQSSAQGNDSGTDKMASGFATTTFGNDLLLGYGTEGTGAAGTNFVMRSPFESDVLEDRIVTTAGSYQATATMVSGVGWEMSMAAFKGF